MNNRIAIFALAVMVSFAFAGCDNQSNNVAQPENPSTLEQSNGAPAALPSSSGDIDEDFEDIESSLDSIDPDTDFPSVSESELSE
jgi:hypothetical protein